MICQINSGTIANFQTLISTYPLTLSTPAEKQRCVKCAVTWRHKNTTMDPVRYSYLNIPTPFEPNTDDLLMGLNNKDFDWTVNELNNGVKATGKYPNVNELVAPYRINWASLQAVSGEQSGPPFRAQYQADWFVNRTPVLLKLKQGTGFWLINELLLESGGANGTRIGNLLLTSLGASVGSTNTFYNLTGAIDTAKTPVAIREFNRLPEGFMPVLKLLENGNLKYTVPKAGTVEFALYNIKGQTISRLTKKVAEGSGYLTEWKLPKLARSGMYFVSMKMDGKRLAVCRMASF
jgi:hypothetical protein